MKKLKVVHDKGSMSPIEVVAIVLAMLLLEGTYSPLVAVAQQISTTRATPANGAASSAVVPSSPNPLCVTEPCAPMIAGWLHTVASSTSVFEGTGYEVPLVGVDVDGLDFGTGNPASAPDSCGKGWSIPSTSFSEVASWGFNIVRVPISWENIEPEAPTRSSNGTWIHHWNTEYLDELDTVVSQFGKSHMAVIFDFAQVDVSGAFQQAPEIVQGGECEGWGNPTWLYPGITRPTTSQDLATAMCNFFNDRSMVGSDAPQPIEAMEAAETMLASRYVDNSTLVGIDMFNEPWFTSSCGTTSQEGALLTSFYTKMGMTISKANPHLLLIFEDSTPGLMRSTPIIATAPSVPNAMYEFHIYTSDWATAQPYVQAFLDNARKFGVPIWMGEFDAFEAGCTGANCKLDPDWEADTESLLTFCNSNGINWAYFSYYSLGTSVQTPVLHAEILAVLRAEIPKASPVSVTCKSAAVVVGLPVNCKVNVSGSGPTGTITWTTSGSGKFSRGSCVLSKGSCSVSYTPTSASLPSTTLYASYSGDSKNPPGFGIYALAVTMKASKVEITCKPPSVKPESSTTCTAAVSGYNPSGIVSWLVKGGTGLVSISSSMCALAKHRCSVTITGEGIGMTEIQATYSGDYNNTGSSMVYSLDVT